jgi:hypothetical protein
MAGTNIKIDTFCIPAQKTISDTRLSDEEIWELAKQCKAPWHNYAVEPMKFARAIEAKVRGEK